MNVLLIGALIFMTLGLIAFGVMSMQSQKQVETRMSDMAQALQPAQNTASRPTTRQYNDSFTQRVVIPFARNLSDRIQFLLPLSGQSWVRQKLTQAGYGKKKHFQTFTGIHCIACVLAPISMCAILLLTRTATLGMALLIVGIFAFMGFMMPLIWLMQQAKKRQDSIRKSLPDFLDLLVICVEAGLGLDMAFSRITKIDSVKSSPYLRDEVLHYARDIGFGKPRKEALLALSARTGVDDLNAIINALIQSFEMGTGVVQALKVQSDSLRTKRLHRAEEAANKISVKMVLPIYLFFFPGIFIVILGPLILSTITQIMHQVSTNGTP